MAEEKEEVHSFFDECKKPFIHIHQYTIAHGRYEKWRNGTLLQTELERFPLRWYGVEEFKLMLEEIGNENIVISADYNYGKYPENPNQAITFETVANKKWLV